MTSPPRPSPAVADGLTTSGLVFNLQKYSLDDGPGIRTTVFLKGCPLCCAWCHNPEGIEPRPELVVVESRCLVCGECRAACPLPAAAMGEGLLPVRLPDCRQCAACTDACPTGARQWIGRTLTVGEVLREVLQDRIFYEESGGGMTISGGEPLAQPRFLLALLEAARAASVSAVLDTTGFGSTEVLLAAARLADLVLYDLKAFDDARHERLTGVSNRRILANLEALDEGATPVWIRLPVVPGFNDDLEDLGRMARYVARRRRVTRVNLLPFHRAGVAKFQRLGMVHALDGVEAPSVERLAAVRRVFEAAGVSGVSP
jgi:pyruvate formate lyase activating enzyme